jgi:hypothetical protein
VTCLPRTPHVTSNTLDRPARPQERPACGGGSPRPGDACRTRSEPPRGASSGTTCLRCRKWPRRGPSRPITPSAPSQTRTASSSPCGSAAATWSFPCCFPTATLTGRPTRDRTRSLPGPWGCCSRWSPPAARAPWRARTSFSYPRLPSTPQGTGSAGAADPTTARPGRRAGADDCAALRRRTARSRACRAARPPGPRGRPPLARPHLAVSGISGSPARLSLAVAYREC